MAFTIAIGATRAISKAVPTVKTNGKVKTWDLTIVYSCGGLTKDFQRNIEVEYLDKEPTAFTKDELLNLANVVHLDMVFDSFYGSMTAPPTETRDDSFDVTSLA